MTVNGEDGDDEEERNCDINRCPSVAIAEDWKQRIENQRHDRKGPSPSRAFGFVCANR